MGDDGHLIDFGSKRRVSLDGSGKDLREGFGHFKEMFFVGGKVEVAIAKGSFVQGFGRFFSEKPAGSPVACFRVAPNVKVGRLETKNTGFSVFARHHAIARAKCGVEALPQIAVAEDELAFHQGGVGFFDMLWIRWGSRIRHEPMHRQKIDMAFEEFLG